jgi:hypothetical protein
MKQTRKEFTEKYLSELQQLKTFEEIFNYAHEKMISITCDESANRLEALRGLSQSLKNLILYIDVDINSIINLADMIDMQIGLTALSLHNNEISEKEYHKYILDNFNQIFPDYILQESEFKIEGVGRIDILAKDKNTDREVIIELKTKKQNPTKQLLAYSKDFENPILIGITEKEINMKSRIEGILYFTYQELGINLNDSL